MLVNQNTSLGDFLEKDMVNGYSPSPDFIEEYPLHISWIN